CSSNGVWNHTLNQCVCNSGYVGFSCQFQCDANSTCNGRGTCDFESGCCLCDEGYVGMRCEHSCHLECSARGSCYQNTTTGLGSCMCTDTDRWTGRVCNEARCPGSSISGSFLQYCSGRGLCNKALHQCYCEPGWLGGDCSVIDCPGDPDCSSHGSCGLSQDAQPVCTCSDGTCDCNPLSGWRGESCEVPGCPGYNGLDCTGHGECISSTHTCVCDAGWRGVACHEPDCPGEPDCFNRGTCCDSAEADCTCEPGWRGIGCEYPDCPGSNHTDCPGEPDCMGRGVCDGVNFEPPRCVNCAAGWMGVGCDEPCFNGTQIVANSDQCTCHPCSNNGACDVDLGVCLCERAAGDAWVGVDGSCSGNGMCSVTSSSCECFPGWTGVDCATPECPEQCNGHGECLDTSPRQCKYVDLFDCIKQLCCYIGNKGPTCSIPSCPGWPLDCSGHGDCNLGSRECECTPGWKGPYCVCDHPYMGDECELTCHHGTPQRTINGTWWCQCDPCYAGDDCMCSCGAGYYGIACEYQCRNGSINEAAQNCSCAPCYSGHACDVLCSNI
uniref:EGF-like domain-containing protein n=1 Tax=Ciona savignyi TaxID=51511 RepID=H2Z5F1_CIOSA